MHVNKNCTVMTHALVNFSPWLRICSWLELRGKRIVSYVRQVREEQMVSVGDRGAENRLIFKQPSKLAEKKMQCNEQTHAIAYASKMSGIAELLEERVSKVSMFCCQAVWQLCLHIAQLKTINLLPKSGRCFKFTCGL